MGLIGSVIVIDTKTMEVPPKKTMPTAHRPMSSQATGRKYSFTHIRAGFGLLEGGSPRKEVPIPE